MACPRKPTRQRFDWTRNTLSSDLTDFQRFTREKVDWAKSPLGVMVSWPPSLRRAVLSMMLESGPAAVTYGPTGNAAVVYNEAFASLITSRHPALQGQLVRGQLTDFCPDIDALLERQADTGSIEVLRDQRIRRQRLGLAEEKIVHWKFAPIIDDDDGYIVGSSIVITEEKGSSRRERSRSAVREFGNVLTHAIDFTTKKTAQNILRLDEHFSGKSCDCDKLWQATQRLEQQETMYQSFADLAPVGICSLDKNRNIDWANRAFMEITGLTRLEQSFLSLIHPDDSKTVQDHLKVGPQREHPLNFECRLNTLAPRAAVSPSGPVMEDQFAWILASIHYQADGDLVCWSIDITSHKLAEAFLRKRMDEAVQMRQQKERFIDMISHEVRNPLSAMMHCTDEIMESTKADERSSGIYESASTIAYCAQHIRNIVGDVLTLSKLDSQLVQIVPVPTRPREVVENALKIFDGQFRLDNIEASIEEDASVGEMSIDWMLLDSKRVLQVLINLITNAMKGMLERPERKLTIRLGASTSLPSDNTDITFVPPRSAQKSESSSDNEPDPESVYLITTVEDTGVGLSPEESASLLERFSQVNPKTESRYGGPGLGLFISRDLTELQGGRFGLATHHGVGSKFVFVVQSQRIEAPRIRPKAPTLEFETRLMRVPSVPTVEVPLRLQTLAVSETPAIVGAPSPLHGRGVTRTQADKPPARKILVVEDNLVNQKVLAKQLRKRGYEVGVAIHGEEALQSLEMTESSVPQVPTCFDIVLMDIEMPVMDGITCAKRIRAFEEEHRTARLPIIAVTANVRDEHEVSALEAGMDGVTTKPYRIEDLVQRIEDSCKTSG